LDIENVTTTKTDEAAKTIAELITDPGFPESARGEKVEINGFTGVIMDIVKNSIKVRSAEGSMMSYNFNALRRLHGPRRVIEEPTSEAAAEVEAAKEPAPKREVILEPDFDAPLIPIEEVVHNPEFPKIAFGRHIDLHGYSGVVIELVGRSLKVRSPEGSTRSYNADGLRKIYLNDIPSASRSNG
jgi:hypothetical protein